MRPAPEFLPPVGRSLWLLREDAISQGLPDLAIAYGWSLIRIGRETAAEKIRNWNKP